MGIRQTAYRIGQSAMVSNLLVKTDAPMAHRCRRQLLQEDCESPCSFSGAFPSFNAHFFGMARLQLESVADLHETTRRRSENL